MERRKTGDRLSRSRFVPKEQPASAAEAASVAEHDLEKALAGAGDDRRGYGTPTVKVKCQNCNAIPF